MKAFDLVSLEAECVRYLKTHFDTMRPYGASMAALYVKQNIEHWTREHGQSFGARVRAELREHIRKRKQEASAI